MGSGGASQSLVWNLGEPPGAPARSGRCFILAAQVTCLGPGAEGEFEG